MNRLSAILITAFLLTSCSVLPTPGNNPPETIRLPDLGQAPELTNQVWINTDQPLRLADLRGKVVLLDMWTFG